MSNVNVKPVLMTREEARTYLNISMSKLQDLYRREVIRSKKIGRSVKFLETDLEAYVASL